MAKISAGLLMFRTPGHRLEVLLVHPGGPFWSKKDAGAWFVPKGEVGENEVHVDAAKREFEEETGLRVDSTLVALGSVKHKSGKIVHAWAFCGDCDPNLLRSNVFSMEWPPHSGETKEFPEVDRAAFFDVALAKTKMYSSEFELVHRLEDWCKKEGLIRDEAEVRTESSEPVQRKLF